MTEIEITSFLGKIKIKFSFEDINKASKMGSYIAKTLSLLKADDNFEKIVKYIYLATPEIIEIQIIKTKGETITLNKEELKKNSLKALLSLSGGLDSTVLLYYLINKGLEIKAISFDYGSKHNDREIPCAVNICKKLGIDHQIICLDFINKHFKSDLLQNGGEIPEGHYAADNMKSTVVPFRNGIMLSISAGIAESNDCDFIALASHSGDHTVYPDCRPEFTKAFSEAIFFGTEKEIQLVAPFNDISKAKIVELGNELGVDFSLTYSCYKGGDKHCGKCGTCVERKEAFNSANIKDPTTYEV